MYDVGEQDSRRQALGRAALVKVARAAGVKRDHHQILRGGLEKAIEYAWSTAKRQEARALATDLVSSPRGVRRPAKALLVELEKTSLGARFEIERYLHGSADLDAHTIAIDDLKGAAGFAADRDTPGWPSLKPTHKGRGG